MSATDFQARVQQWLRHTFDAETCSNTAERNHRFLEEALELVQALGCTKAEALRLVDYTYGRPAGHPPQEVGGVLVCLAALCSAADILMATAGDDELSRCWAMVDKIRTKHAAKPRFSPLPGPTVIGFDPSSELVDDVARAIAAKTIDPALYIGWDKLLPGTQSTYREMARAAIQAVIVPEARS